MIKYLIYDFDGVICDSVNIKTEAFLELYKNENNHIKTQIKNYHLDNGGVSRFKKIKYFETIILKKKYSKSKNKVLTDYFGELVKEKVTNSEYINGALEFLKKKINYSKQFICTGTPELEIKEILKNREIDYLFDEVYGSPKTKTEIINKIIKDNCIKNSDCVFFGDTMTDYNASVKTGVPFVGIMNKNTIFPKGTILINDFYDNKLNSL
mgnify:CR=1 FL=1